MPYESKPMKKQWVEVDGKMTPIILPQIWSHEKQDWVVTSEQNPLPTQVTGSIVEHTLQPNVTVTPGSSYRIDDIIFKSRKITFGVQFSSQRSNKVSTISRTPNGSEFFDYMEEEPLYATGRRASYEITLRTMNTDIRIDNTDIEDLIIQDIIIVEGE